jgi:HEPN domain-containing protein
MQAYEEWLWKAENDLLGAQALLKIDRTFDLAVYHAHQSAEKSFKAYLAYKNQPIARTHSLIFLLELCYDFDGNFWILLPAAKYLNPFSVRFRYPTDVLLPEQPCVVEAIKHAKNILHFVRKKIREKSKPKKNIFY